jgi:hypothetical protein
MLSLKYFSNGTYYVPGELGSWRLQGDTLTEVTTSFLEIHDEATADLIGKTYVATLRWVDQDTFLKYYTGGRVKTFSRCPNPN